MECPHWENLEYNGASHGPFLTDLHYARQFPQLKTRLACLKERVCEQKSIISLFQFSGNLNELNLKFKKVDVNWKYELSEGTTKKYWLILFSHGHRQTNTV